MLTIYRMDYVSHHPLHRVGSHLAKVTRPSSVSGQWCHRAAIRLFPWSTRSRRQLWTLLADSKVPFSLFDFILAGPKGNTLKTLNWRFWAHRTVPRSASEPSLYWTCFRTSSNFFEVLWSGQLICIQYLGRCFLHFHLFNRGQKNYSKVGVIQSIIFPGCCKFSL